MNDNLIHAEELKLMNYHCIVSIDPDSGIASCLIPPDSYPDQWNPELFPYDEAMTYLIEGVICEDDAVKVVEDMRLSTVKEALSQQKSYVTYYSCAGKNFTTILRKATFIPREDGKIILFLMDITEDALELRKSNLTLQQERTDAIIQSNIERRMLDLLDREVRTHLFSMIGLTDFLVDDATDDGSEYLSFDQADKMIEKIYLSEKQMLEILNDVRELQSVVTIDHPLEDTPISIEELLKYCDEVLASYCEFKNTLFTWDTSEVKSDTIYTDGEILGNFLLRLARFILDTSSNNGIIELKVTEQPGIDNYSDYTFTLKSDRCNLTRDQLIDVTMDYNGLFREIQKDLNAIDFNRILLKKYAQMLHGNLSVDTNDEMSEINIKLSFKTDQSDASLNKKASVPKSDAEKSIPDFTGKTALVVDDNIINLEVTSHVLKNAGFLVVDVDNGQEGYETYIRDQGKFDVIILDIRMPGMDGVELAKKIRDYNEESKKIPIIALTANDRSVERKQSIDAGMNDHLFKPISPKVLYQVLGKYL